LELSEVRWLLGEKVGVVNYRCELFLLFFFPSYFCGRRRLSRAILNFTTTALIVVQLLTTYPRALIFI